jgi:hypothetical protein
MMIVLISTFIVRNPDRIGQGLGEIMWNGWNCLFISLCSFW